MTDRDFLDVDEFVLNSSKTVEAVSSRFIFPIESHLKFPVKEVGLELV
jgi:hypothetical protein